MKKNKWIVYFILFFIIFLTPLSVFFYRYNEAENFEEDNVKEINEKNLKPSDIAGSDLYAEKINAFVAGNKSIIKQSLFTNDTNILSQFDSNDPAFYKCNVIMSASNGIKPAIFPNVLTENDITSQYHVGFNNFVGFLFYDQDVKPQDAESRAERALEIIRRKFKIDLIMINVSEPNFFPFIGSCPNWDCYFSELTTNFPMDGYWKALDLNRLLSQQYLENYHISSTFLLLNSLDFFNGDYDISTDQVNFNIDSIDLSFLESLEIEELIDQLDAALESFGDSFNATVSEEELEQFVEIFSAFTLKNDSHYTSISVQYEGLAEGIEQIGKNQYKFNLWDALGYQGSPLAPSKKIYIALTGALMSEIKIDILCTDIIDTTPLYFDFYDYLLEQIGLLLYFAGIEFDIQSLEDYSFELLWADEEGIKQSYVKPINRQDPTDIINMLQQLGFQGFSYIPTGIVEPIGQFTITYNISNSDPNLLLKKELIEENASYGVFRNFSYYITAENVGNKIAWGVPTPIPLELDYFFQIVSPIYWENVKNDMWNRIKIEYPNQYNSLEDFFNFDDDPRIFYFDSFGIGTYDTYYPNILNISNLWPYNEDADYIIGLVYNINPAYFPIFDIDTVKELFTNEDSIWNDDNWRLNPGEIISYQIDNYSISNLDSFTPFYRNNFTIDFVSEIPEIVSGTTLYNTSPDMALSTDNSSWTIGSVEKYLEETIEINFIFSNDTQIDFTNFILEKISILINFTISEDLESLDFAIFNFENEEFQDISPNLDSITNDSWTFSFINDNQTTLNWLFYPSDNEDYIVLFKIRCLNPDPFNISINDLDIEFSTRDINFNEDSGARVVYSSSFGTIQFERRSNSIPLSTYDAASIIATSYLTNYSSTPGGLNNYCLTFKNIGANSAKNISISLLIPGIIENPNDFTLQNSNLTYFLSSLEPSEEKTINFTFYVPNSISISDVLISYNNPENIEGGNSSRIVSLTNEVYVSAFVDYEDLFPLIRTIEINYNKGNINSINNSPGIGDLFNLTINLKNVGPFGFNLPDINISMNDQFGDLKRIDNKSLYLIDIAYNETLSFNITLKKIGWKGYYYPPINFVESSESRVLQIYRSTSLILGEINLSIIKNVNKDQIEIKNSIIVSIEVENTGTISIANIIINDMISYSQSDFSLEKGKLVNLIDSLDPGEKVTFNYTLKAKRQNLVSLKPTSIKFYYLNENEVISNSVIVKIIIPKIRQYSYIFLSFLIAFGVFIIYFWQIKRYKKKRIEFQRSEMQIFELSSRETILKIEHDLTERLAIMSNKSKEKSINFETN
ncbi:MAG: hypothetical protein ACFE9Q_03685 [Candidatus Hodarchaeota archaeon]